jgi:hypothetical protein
MVLCQDKYRCVKCDKKYTDGNNKWCKSCQINYLKRNFTNWTSENKKIDQFIQEMQLKIDSYNDIVFEWIQYSQYDNIKEIYNDKHITVYSAVWKDGSLNYNNSKYEYIRYQNNKVVTLKCLNNSQDIIDKFLNKV